MSKAEEFAYSKYPEDKKGILYDLARNSIIQGYHQAEKDLELSWKDVKKIIRIHTDIYLDFFIHDNDYKVDTKEYYQEVLRRFKELKGE